MTEVSFTCSAKYIYDEVTAMQGCPLLTDIFFQSRTHNITHATLYENKRKQQLFFLEINFQLYSSSLRDGLLAPPPVPPSKIFLYRIHNVSNISINDSFISLCVPYLYGCTLLVH